jgi:Homing endonuclease associated repeat
MVIDRRLTGSLWEAITALPEREQHRIWRRLGAHIGADSRMHPRIGERQERAITALREAAAESGFAPSSAEFNRLRRTRSDRAWPSETTIRRSMGGTWRRCLEVAGLPPATVTHKSRERREQALQERTLSALLEAATLLGRPTRVREYSKLRADDPARTWPSAATIQRTLGKAWDDCLAAAGLNPHDLAEPISHRPRSYTRAELVAAIQGCGRDLSDVPSLAQYLRWAKQPAQRQRRPAPPASPRPFQRSYGTWLDAVADAGMLEQPRNDSLVQRQNNRHAVYRLSDETCAEAVRTAAHALGHPPTATQYRHFRDRLLNDGHADEAAAIVSYTQLNRRYGKWNEVLAMAGLAHSHPTAR